MHLLEQKPTVRSQQRARRAHRASSPCDACNTPSQKMTSTDASGGRVTSACHHDRPVRSRQMMVARARSRLAAPTAIAPCRQHAIEMSPSRTERAIRRGSWWRSTKRRPAAPVLARRPGSVSRDRRSLTNVAGPVRTTGNSSSKGLSPVAIRRYDITLAFRAPSPRRQILRTIRREAGPRRYPLGRTSRAPRNVVTPSTRSRRSGSPDARNSSKAASTMSVP